MKNAAKLILLSSILGLTSCFSAPTSSNKPAETSSQPQLSSEAKASSEEPSSEESSSEESSSPIQLTTEGISSNESIPAVSSAESSSESSLPVLGPTLSLPLGSYKGKVAITKPEMTTADYHIAIPYAGNKYEFPAPTLENYQGEYDLSYSDSITITFSEKENALFICAKYDFGGYFHMKALSKAGEEIASLYLHLETTKVGEGELHVFHYNSDEEIEKDSTVTLAPGETLKVKPTYNGTAHYGILSSSDESIVSIVSSAYSTTLQANSVGEALITASYSEEDGEGTLRDYEFSFTLKVYKEMILSSIYLEGEEVYLINGEAKYNGTFYAEYASGEKEAIAESEIVSEIAEEGKVAFSYTANEITKSVTYSAKSIEAQKYSATALKHSYEDYWKHYSTGHTTLPLSGNLNLLVIPVWFSNSTDYFDASKKEEIAKDIETICFGEEKMGAGTLKTFYETESQGSLTITGKVADWYVDEYPSTNYNDQILDTFHGLFNRALSDYIEKNPEDHIENYDRNQDNKFDGVIFFYAANYFGTLTTTNSNGFALNFNDSGVGGNAYMNNCCVCPVGDMYGFRKNPTEAQKGTDDLSKLNPEAFLNGANIAIHEVGHMLGAVDLYTAAGNARTRATEQAHQYAGQFSMQDNNKGSHDPLQTYLCNWGKPMVFSADKYKVGTKLSVYLDDFQANHSSILLSPSWNEYDSPFDEYMLLELFSPSGLNEFHAKEENAGFDATGSGIRLWHADAGLMKDNNNKRGYFPVQQGTSFIASNHDVWDMNNYHFAQMIRNDESADYEPINGMVPTDLFKANDAFSMERFNKQFLNEEALLDSGKKLGWEFKITSLFHNGKGGYSASVELTRVDDTITEFQAATEFSNVSQWPSGDSVDATDFFHLNKSHLVLTAERNQSATPLSVAYQSPDYYLLLGKESYLELSMATIEENEQTKPIGVIKKIQLIYMLGTNVTPRTKPSVFVNDASISGSKDPLDVDVGEPFYMSEAYSYDVNAASVRIQNKSDAGLYLNAIRIYYSIPVK